MYHGREGTQEGKKRMQNGNREDAQYFTTRGQVWIKEMATNMVTGEAGRVQIGTEPA